MRAMISLIVKTATIHTLIKVDCVVCCDDKGEVCSDLSQ